jgi:transposase-like protein
MSNKYQESSRLSDAKYRQIVKCFALDLTATQTADLCSISRNAVNRVYARIRELILEQTRSESPFSGEIEADESYFGPRRVKGKRGRGAGSKTIVFGLLKRDGKVYTEIVPNAKVATLQPIIRGHASIESVIHTDGWAGYNGLVDVGFEKHFRVNHGENEFSTGDGNHINGIESFWGYAKHRLAKFKGIRRDLFEIYLKETEFRFNHRGQGLYHLLLKMLRVSR